jgi:hypothetical protein
VLMYFAIGWRDGIAGRWRERRRGGGAPAAETATA